MSTAFGPGRLDETWLAGKDASDPWVFTTEAPDAPGHRDAFLGNGWMGQRFGVEGDASSYPVENRGDTTPSGCLVLGLWDDGAKLLAPPRWAVLEYHDHCSALASFFRKGEGKWNHYSQRLDLRTATLTTDVTWTSDSGRTTKLKTTAYLSRSRPNVAVIEREFTPDFTGEARVVDVLDGTCVGNAGSWRKRRAPKPDWYPHGVPGDEAVGLEFKVKPKGRQVAVVSKLQIDGGTPVILIEESEKGIRRTVRFQVKAGHSYRVVKFTALCTDEDGASPWLKAWNLVEGAARRPEKLREEHVAAWRQLWAANIETGHPKVQRTINSALFQLYCNLREGSKWIPGPPGLSSNSWQGHAFWDDDLWMFPALCALHPELGRCFADYRKATLPGAIRNARSEGYDGAMIAWESAEAGDETIPHLFYHLQHHVNSDVVLGLWQYHLLSGDDDATFKDNGLPVILECAKFWASRAEFNQDQDRYEIRGVCCADEFAEVKDNNAYTNYSAARTLRLAASLADRFGLERPAKWTEIADKLWIPFDDGNQIILEYEGYAGQTIKQADAALLIYPYEMPMSDAVKAKTVDYYRERYPQGNIMMAAAFDGIVDCELKRPEKAWASFKRLIPHFREPFLLTSESPGNEVLSFLTGLGGLLQLVMMGFCGVRIHEDGLLVEPCVPNELGTIVIHGMHYAGVSFDLTVSSDGKVSVGNASAPLPFRIYGRDGRDWPAP